MEGFTHAGLTVQVHAGWVSVDADGAALYAWANRPGANWPCSTLEDMDRLVATFDSSGLIDLRGDEGVEMDGHELNAFTADAIAAVLDADHPIYFVTVGQFA